MDILHVKFCLLTIENLKIFKLCVEGDVGVGGKGLWAARAAAAHWAQAAA